MPSICHSPSGQNRSCWKDALIAMVILGLVAALAACDRGRQRAAAPPARTTPGHTSTLPTTPGPIPSTPTPEAVAPTESAGCQPASTRLSFVSERAGGSQIYVLDIRRPDEARQITDLPGFVEDPAWSPDGQHVAFRWFRPQRDSFPRVSVANADGSDVRLLVKNAAMPTWSPDGHHIAFANLNPLHRGISTIDIDRVLGGQRAPITIVTETEADVPEEGPAWSPDGKRIAFTSHRSGNSDVWTINADGSHMRAVTSGLFLDTAASWSPDGTHIVLTSNRAAPTALGGDLFEMRSDGTDVHRLTDDDVSFASAWSPDGQWIAFHSLRDGDSELYVMRPDGTQQHRLTVQAGADGVPAWVGLCRRP